eukprot:CAMPEP_0185281186 /NCGR_PEP_ID=MMETSP1359-20130426/66576_1 /TAXON_ID=552665 /ORGANISM="Bigelowiella longifila, Strain CCMP242" /LENGTH=184 /DNA_ID=CAMNT_0027876589 /DNA_START=338 /DNA_END=892 /DNA_ORIENTATION=-
MVASMISGTTLFFEVMFDAFVAKGAILVQNVKVGERSSIWYNSVLRGDVASIEIGRNTNIQDGTVIHVASEQQGTKGKLNTIIGDGVTVGHMALLHACKIEDNAFVGMKACVMDGAVVRSHGMLAAGALLTPGKIVGGGELWAGQPAKLMRKLTEKEIENIYNSAENYAILAACYRQNLLTEFK